MRGSSSELGRASPSRLTITSPALEARAVGGTAGLDVGDERALRAFEPERLGERGVDRLDGDAEPAARDVAGAHELDRARP